MTGSKASGHSGKTALRSVTITEMDETGMGNTTGKSLYPIVPDHCGVAIMPCDDIKVISREQGYDYIEAFKMMLDKVVDIK